MKKLALALVCFASLAFFASCAKEGQPTIQVLNEEGYVLDGQTINVGEEINFGFVVASSAETNKELSTLVVKIDDYEELTDTINLAGMTSYTYKGTISYSAKDEIIGTSIITAIVTDVAGQTATASINLTINQPDQPLLGSPITWVRRGANNQNAEEMAGYGLQWTGTYKDPFATIKPVDGAQLYVCDGADYEGIVTMSDKNAYFTNLAETATPAEFYRNIDANASANYDDMLAVIYGDKLTLVHITHAKVESITTVGTQITITGELK
jgi:hypothetical protein